MRLAAAAGPQRPGSTRDGDRSAAAEAGLRTEPVSVQRADDDGPPAVGAVSPPPGPATASSPLPSAAERLSQEQVDELAKRLVGPIVRRIKADMLLDRERRGLRIDAS